MFLTNIDFVFVYFQVRMHSYRVNTTASGNMINT